MTTEESPPLYTPDPNRPPQSSGVADVQLVEAVSAHIARLETRLIEQQTQTRLDIQEAMHTTAKVVDKIMEHNLKQLADDLHRTLARYQSDMRSEINRLDSRVDVAFSEVDATNKRLDMVLPPTAEAWIRKRVNVVATRVIVAMVIVNLLFFVLSALSLRGGA